MKITVQDYRRTQTKHRKAKKGHGWTKLGRIEMDCIWVNLKIVGPLFFKFVSVYIKISFTQRETHLGKFENRQPTFFQICVSLYQNIIYTAGNSLSVVMWP